MLCRPAAACTPCPRPFLPFQAKHAASGHAGDGAATLQPGDIAAVHAAAEALADMLALLLASTKAWLEALQVAGENDGRQDPSQVHSDWGT